MSNTTYNYHARKEANGLWSAVCPGAPELPQVQAASYNKVRKQAFKTVANYLIDRQVRKEPLPKDPDRNFQIKLDVNNLERYVAPPGKFEIR